MKVVIVESRRHGKCVAGEKRTSTIQVQVHPEGLDYYLLKGQFRFTVGDEASKAKATEKAKTLASEIGREIARQEVVAPSVG